MGFKKTWIWVVGLLLLGACSKEEQEGAHDHIRLLGHGGMGIYHTFPMNSMESILRSLSFPVDGTEVDVQMTRDSILVLFHDREMEASTGFKGVIADQEWSTIQNVYYRFPAHAQYKVVRLNDLLDQPQPPNLYLDIKMFQVGQPYNSYRDRFVRTLVRTLLDSEWDLSRIAVESGDSLFLNQFRSLVPESPLYFKGSLTEAVDAALTHAYRGIVLSVEGLQKREVTWVQDQGLEVVGFNIHTRSRHRKALELGIDVIQSDNVPYMVRLMGR